MSKELVGLLGSTNEAVRQHASEALRDIGSEGGSHSSELLSGSGSGAQLVTLLKDGINARRVEAQEYALSSLASPALLSDATARQSIIDAGCIEPIITALASGKLSVVAQRDTVLVLAGLAPLGQNAHAIKAAGGIVPLVALLAVGNLEAKEHAATTLAQLAQRAGSALEIAEAGSINSLVSWLGDPTLGPPDVAARTLSSMALAHRDCAVQAAEEGAVQPLIELIRSWSRTWSAWSATTGAPAAVLSASSHAAGTLGAALPPLTRDERRLAAAALRFATVAASCLATLAAGSVVIQVIVAEEGGIQPLIDLLKDDSPSSRESAARAICAILGQCEENRSAVPRAGGVPPLVALLTSESEATALHAAAALESLAFNHTENQVLLARSGAIDPMLSLLGSESKETQGHAVGTVLSIASHDEECKTAVVKKLIGVLDGRSAAAQLKAAEALAVLASRSTNNRKAILAANAIKSLVSLIGDGRRVRKETPQERAAAVLADLARLGEAKVAITNAGGVGALVAMLSSPDAQTHASAALFHLASVKSNQPALAQAGAVAPLVALLADGTSEDSQKYAAGCLWNLCASPECKAAIVNAGCIPLLVKLLDSDSLGVIEHAAAVLSILARTAGGNKKAIVAAGGLGGLIAQLRAADTTTQKHAACALWGLAEGKEGVYDKEMVSGGMRACTHTPSSFFAGPALATNL